MTNQRTFHWRVRVLSIAAVLVLAALAVPFVPRVSAATGTLATITTFRCAGAPLSFPVGRTGYNGGYIGWIYRDPASRGTDPSGLHSGLDFYAGNGAPAAAIGTGKVLKVEYFPKTGKYGVDIYYPSINLQTFTGELKNPQVAAGMWVSVGRIIGYENGDHIHFSFEVGYNDQNPNWGPSTLHRDPTPYLAPYGNFDYARGAREHWWTWTYQQWCGSQPAVPAPPLGGVDVWQYCVQHGSANGYVLTENDAYGYACKDASGALHGINMDNVCSWQYHRSDALARFTNFYSTTSWQCYGSAGILGSIDFNAYCVTQGGTGSTTLQNNAYGVSCRTSSGGTFLIDTDRACRQQYRQGAALARVVNFYDPNGWQCFVSKP